MRANHSSRPDLNLLCTLLVLLEERHVTPGAERLSVCDKHLAMNCSSASVASSDEPQTMTDHACVVVLPETRSSCSSADPHTHLELVP